MISSLLSKCFLSALVGSPIAFSINVTVLPTLSEIIDENICFHIRFTNITLRV